MSGGSPVGGAEMRDFFARKAERVGRERQTLLAQAQADARTIIEHIKKVHNPVRIHQWGSLVHTEGFTERSDIDIAVEGLAHPFDLHRILDFAETVTTMPLDIVPIEEIEPEYADAIRTNGRVVYERE